MVNTMTAVVNASAVAVAAVTTFNVTLFSTNFLIGSQVYLSH
jgi:hypothetical protein